MSTIAEDTKDVGVPHQTFSFMFKISPPGDFGLPEGDTTVVKAGSTNICTSTIFSPTGDVVAHATLSRYREEADAINLRCVIDSVNITIKDNFLCATIESLHFPEAQEVVTATVDRLAQILATDRAVYFRLEYLYATQETPSGPELVRKPGRVRRSVPFGSALPIKAAIKGSDRNWS